MVDISSKETVRREATAEGFIRLQPDTISAIRKGSLEKGNPIEISKVAGIMAAKRTPDIVPLCHNIQIESVEIEVEVEKEGVRIRSRVVGIAKTGVEMEALTATSASLLAFWDVVKKFEKDEDGQYPNTEISSVRVLKKVKAR
ncbi:MAG: cyclic pyranopterin monophosphate synthase MoaC [Nitrososphaerota archaeon]|nr:cyclic pyranopterin monophosphate synthase MoaC [Nitrososphaerota archaeon]